MPFIPQKNCLELNHTVKILVAISNCIIIVYVCVKTFSGALSFSNELLRGHIAAELYQRIKTAGQNTPQTLQ